MSAATAEAPAVDDTPGAPAAPQADAAASRRRRPPLGLFGLPIFVAIVLIGWLIWRLNANLDSIEMRNLAWAGVGQNALGHLELTIVGTLVVVIIAVPLGILLTRPGAKLAAPIVVGFANGGQAAPAIGLLVLFAMWLGFGFWTAIVGLAIYAILPVLRNTIVGLQGVDRNLVEAARGMGMSNGMALRRIELPLAVPVIMSGVRTALILMVGTATLATFIDAGGLGTYITTGITLFRFPILITGALLVSCLALLIDWLGRLLEFFVRPKGI